MMYKIYETFYETGWRYYCIKDNTFVRSDAFIYLLEHSFREDLIVHIEKIQRKCRLLFQTEDFSLEYIQENYPELLI